jgi:TIR domain
MPESKVFVSYSHDNKKYREEVRRVLETVPSIQQALWFEEKHIGISDKFDPSIRQAMETSSIGILLLSTDFFLSSYITQNELPYLLRRAEQGTLQLACIYVTAIPEGAFQRTIDIDGQPRTVSIKEYIGANSPGKPLEALWRKSQRLKVYVELADWVAQQLADEPVPTNPGSTSGVASATPPWRTVRAGASAATSRRLLASQLLFTARAAFQAPCPRGAYACQPFQ